MHVCLGVSERENLNNGMEISSTSLTSLIVGIKVLSALSVMGLSANGKIRGRNIT